MTRNRFLACLCGETITYFKESARSLNCDCEVSGYYFLSLDEDGKNKVRSEENERRKE